MIFSESRIAGVFVVESENKYDSRGFFNKTFNHSAFAAHGIDLTFRESFYSGSHRDVLRGMHYQSAPHQVEKLVYCSSGEILDVVLDLRQDSETYGMHEKLTISHENAQIVYVPEGVAHGFLTLSESALVCYLQSGEFAPDADTGVLWSSFDCDWGIATPTVSEKDQQLPVFGSRT
jgi:dTDP-4-dehydrorhamnose 3,5-epimerase